MEVRGARGKNEAVRREDGCGALVVGRRKVAGEGDANVRIETRTPHEDEIFAEFVDAQLSSL